MTIAKMIKAIPTHCENTTVSLRIKNAIDTETGNSNEATILPKLIPV